MFDSEFDSERAKKTVGGFLIIMVLLLLIAVLVFFFACWYWQVSPATLGQFGDFMGGTLNPTFSVASLFLITTSLYFTVLNLKLAMEANEFTRFSTQKQIESEIERHKQELLANETKSRRDLTVTWHQNWMSPQMVTLKRNAYGTIETHIANIDRGQHSAFIGGSRTSGDVQVRGKYREIKEVMLLIHHALTFFDGELLDNDLFLKLFQADFKQWHSVLSSLDMRTHRVDETKDGLSEETERQDLVERLARVIGL